MRHDITGHFLLVFHLPSIVDGPNFKYFIYRLSMGYWSLLLLLLLLLLLYCYFYVYMKWIYLLFICRLSILLSFHSLCILHMTDWLTEASERKHQQTNKQARTYFWKAAKLLSRSKLRQSVRFSINNELKSYINKHTETHIFHQRNATIAFCLKLI